MGLFDDDDEKFKISHNGIHEAMHAGHPVNVHKSIHDHSKIHESMHFGADKVVSPLSSLNNNNRHKRR